jgi:serine/threonine protein kinase
MKQIKFLNKFVRQLYIYKKLVFLIIKGVIHRDLKPENILLIFDNKDINRVRFTKLIDFGFAIYYNASELHEKEKLGDCEEEDIFGTPNYVAPEILQSKSATFESDVFSLGAILYAMYDF